MAIRVTLFTRFLYQVSKKLGFLKDFTNMLDSLLAYSWWPQLLFIQMAMYTACLLWTGGSWPAFYRFAISAASLSIMSRLCSDNV